MTSRGPRTSSFRERGARLREVLLANAALRLDDWSPIPREEYCNAPDPAVIARAAAARATLPHVAIRYCPPPVRSVSTEYAYPGTRPAGPSTSRGR
jgi:hypothetical protein